MNLEMKIHLQKDLFDLKIDLLTPIEGVTAIFGPSGCGKSTFLRALAGLDRPTGLIKIGDDIWQDELIFVPTHKRSIGYIFQEANLFSHINVRENLNFGFKRNPSKAKGLTLEEVVEIFCLSKLLQRSTQNLSGGERQKVAIARAILSNPKLILMDEPLSALDQESKSEILNILEKHQKDFEIPFLYVSHSKSEVMRLADRIILIENGKIQASGPIEEILTRTDLPLSHSQDAEVVIQTERSPNKDQKSENFGLLNLTFSGGQFLVPGTDTSRNQKVRLRVSARDVSLCLTKPIDSSVLNIFPATIKELTQESKSQVTAKLDLNGTEILSRISSQSADRLKLSVGKSVFAQIKAVALVE